MSEEEEINKEPILQVYNLSKHFSGLKAVDDVNFQVYPGEIVGIIGPNGAGKTTLFNLLTGFLKPEKGGQIIFKGKDITKWKPAKISKFGMTRTFQHARPFKLLTTLENVTVPHISRSFFQTPRKLKNRSNWSLITVDLAEKKNYPALILPHGDLKRLDFARAMAVKPQILLLDEPFAGVSREEGFRVERLIIEASKQGMTTIIVEHKLSILMKLVQRVLVIHQGRLLMEGNPEEVVNNDEVINAYLGKGDVKNEY